VTTRTTADTLIIGGGLIGLACAASLARDGITVILLDEPRRGVASPAAAGMLAPALDRADGPGQAFSVAARACFPTYLDWLRDGTGIAVPLNDNGILQVALTPAGVRGLRRAMPSSAAWLDAAALHALEPDLAHALGAVHHPMDGAVDNVILIEALRTYCAASARVHIVRAAVLSLVLRADAAAVRTRDGAAYTGRHVVLAAGAWAGSVAGLPRPLPVAPLRGQMLAYGPTSLRHVLFGPRGYIIPRAFADPTDRAHSAGETLVGATSEAVGFDTATTPEGATKLRHVAVEILPWLGESAPHRHWAGLRPMTPDLLPIIGADPSEPSLLYACGHSRNGVLMAPLTGDCITALVGGTSPPADLAPFSIARFPPS
jgi:glycine oxidase